VNAATTAFVGDIRPRRAGRDRDRDIERVDARTIVVRQAEGWALADLELLTSPRDRRWSAGDHVDLTGVRVEVLETTADTRPARASLRWVRWDGRGLVPFAPPPARGSPRRCSISSEVRAAVPARAEDQVCRPTPILWSR